MNLCLAFVVAIIIVTAANAAQPRADCAAFQQSEQPSEWGGGGRDWGQCRTSPRAHETVRPAQGGARNTAQTERQQPLVTGMSTISSIHGLPCTEKQQQ